MRWATDWTFNELKDALEIQLVSDYLKAHDASHGVLVLGRHSLRKKANKTWASPNGPVDLGGLLNWLSAREKEIEATNFEFKRVSVLAVNFEV
jgi:hypothetical protein